MTHDIAPFKVLIVEEIRYMAESLSGLLEEEGYRTFIADSAHKALSMYPELLPDIVALNLYSPGLDGISLLTDLYYMDPAAKTIVVASAGMDARVSEAMELGAKTFVMKPLDKGKVMKAVSAVMAEY